MAAGAPFRITERCEELSTVSLFTRDKRSGKIAVVAHCILNQNSVVAGLASQAAAVRAVVDALLDFKLGILQLPCPELLHGGLRRFWQSKEQYDTPLYRAHCRRLAQEVSEVVAIYVKEGMVAPIVVGIAGSPSCGTEETSSSSWLGNPVEAVEPSRRVPGMGIFMEELAFALKEKGIEPAFVDYDRKKPDESVERIRRAVASRL